MERPSSRRILAQGRCMSNDTWTTGINNNDLIIGPSGAGKTRNYIKPNLLEESLLETECGAGDSLIIADTKGSLFDEVGSVMRAHGYEVIKLDFRNLLDNDWGYNPLDYIRYDERQKKYSEQDILTICNCLIPVETKHDPFWEQSAQMYLSALIGYVLECLPKDEHNLDSVCRLYELMDNDLFERLFQELGEENPKSFAYQSYSMAQGNRAANRAYASIRMFLAKNLRPLSFDGPLHLYQLGKRVDFKHLCQEKTALFLTISDTDRSMDKLANLFYTQALQGLCAIADSSPGFRLPIPVRFILDDFATNVFIPDFDNTISVIRSREIYVSLIIQSINQLYALYGTDKGKTIINNCDNCLYLGGQDADTSAFIGIKAGRTQETILGMALNDIWLFTRGSKPQQVRKYDLREHPLYWELPEAVARTAAASGYVPDASEPPKDGHVSVAPVPGWKRRAVRRAQES